MLVGALYYGNMLSHLTRGAWIEIRRLKQNAHSTSSRTCLLYTSLLPICHTTQQVQVTITLDGSGQFLRAKGNVPEERTTIIPCTEASGSRTSKPVPHPLVDKLQYIAGDYNQFGGTKKSCWSDYLAQLGDWCHSPFAHPDVCLVDVYKRQSLL